MNRTDRPLFGDLRIKRAYLARVEAHRRHDEIVQGIGWSAEPRL